MKRISTALLAITLTSCVATTNYYDQAVNSWQGGNAKTLTNVWGKPNAIETKPDGSKMYVYNTENYHNYSTQGASGGAPALGVNVDRTGRPVLASMPRSNDTWIPSMSITCSAYFTVDAKGKVIATNTRGSNCYGSQRFLNNHVNPNAAPQG